jgi:hypothetical protein
VNKPKKCGIRGCNQVYSTESNLNRHKRAVHKTENRIKPVGKSRKDLPKLPPPESMIKNPLAMMSIDSDKFRRVFENPVSPKDYIPMNSIGQSPNLLFSEALQNSLRAQSPFKPVPSSDIY